MKSIGSFLLASLYLTCGAATPKDAPDRTCGVRLAFLEQPMTPLIQQGDPGMEDITHGLEGGCVLKQGSTYHLFVTELIGEVRSVKTRMAHWTSENGHGWTRDRTLYQSSGDFTGKDPRASLWAAPLAYDEESERWNLFYTAYRSKPSDDTGWYINYEGRIWRAVSEMPGRTGLVGPYKDAGVILQPDSDSQPWEGLQGTDSFHIYRADDRWLAFYGSAQTQLAPKPDPSSAKWNVGLAESPTLAGPWKRRREGNPVYPNVENPVVLRLASGRFLAIFDVLLGRPLAIGYADSRDGVRWSEPAHLELPGGPGFWLRSARTPLGLIPEADGSFSLFYTGYLKDAKGEQGYRCLGLAKINLTEDP
jgi:hypothetical protein